MQVADLATFEMTTFNRGLEMRQQLQIGLIPRHVEGALIHQRALDGYVNATAMCIVAGKQFNDYSRIGPTKAFLTELSSETGIPVSELIQTLRGGNPDQQGTWVHPDVAVNLGQWCSPKFAVAVSQWVREWLSSPRSRQANEMPYHIRRYVANRREVPHTHFSMLNEMILALIGPMEDAGYTLPDNMLPDISEGRMFCKWLRDEKGIDTDSLPTYRHEFEDGRVVYPKLYPNETLADFRSHFYTVWLPSRAVKYFQGKDPSAIPYLEQVLVLPAPR